MNAGTPAAPGNQTLPKRRTASFQLCFEVGEQRTTRMGKKRAQAR
jgi:hypothetical protein